MGKLKIGLFLLVALALTACSNDVFRGSGEIETAVRDVEDFDRIVFSGSGEVILTQDDGVSLTLETDDNLMEYVLTEVNGGTLELGFVPGMFSPTQLTFYVVVDDLTGLTISGSGNIEADRLSAERLEITVSGSGDVVISDLEAERLDMLITGSGDIDLTGEAGAQSLTISGSGMIRAGDVCSPAVDATISGSGDAIVCATETLEAEISGSGSVNYYGFPAVTASGAGSGEINSLEE